VGGFAACPLGIVLNGAQLLNPVIMKIVIDAYLTRHQRRGVVHAGIWFLNTLRVGATPTFW
jgi:ABC-type bacteriocin/lantibiotic exporter with double-glycine peptidase domain